MYRVNNHYKTTLRVNNAYEAETIEQKVNRIVNNKEPIKDGAPLIYTERKDGVKPDYDIRTDRWEHAIDAMDSVTKTELAKRQNRLDAAKQNMETEKKTETKNESGAQSTQGT